MLHIPECHIPRDAIAQADTDSSVFLVVLHRFDRCLDEVCNEFLFNVVESIRIVVLNEARITRLIKHVRTQAVIFSAEVGQRVAELVIRNVFICVIIVP